MRPLAALLQLEALGMTGAATMPCPAKLQEARGTKPDGAHGSRATARMAKPASAQESRPT